MVWNKNWKVILGYREGNTLRQVQKKYHAISRATHPNKGGTTEAMQDVTQSWVNAQAWFERPHKRRGRNENSVVAAKRHRADTMRWNRPPVGYGANAHKPSARERTSPRPPPRKFVVSRAWNSATKNAAAPRNRWENDNDLWERAAREARNEMRRPGKPAAPPKAPVFRVGLTAQQPRKMYATPPPRASPVTPLFRTRYASAGGAARPGLRPRQGVSSR